MTSPSWNRPATPHHAHFDCFSGAAGDMLLAACLDASPNSKDLLDYIIHCLVSGIPELEGEFTVKTQRVLRGKMGSIAGLHIQVQSKYHHAPAPVPGSNTVVEFESNGHCNDAPFEEGRNHSHTHAHSHDHNHLQDHSHGHTHTHQHHVGESTQSHSDGHSHSHSHHPSSIHGGPLRNLPEIQKLLERAPDKYIPPWVKHLGIATFTELAKAEAATHGVENGIDSVHFHEVGAVDSIVDTIGTLLALHCLNVTSVSCSRLPIGEGSVWTAHGCLPVPAPATLRLLVDMPTCPGPLGVVTGELVTPTGAALLKALRRHCPPKVEATPGNGIEGVAPSSLTRILDQGRPPSFTIRAIGVGAGTKNFEKHPNILRLMLGDNVTLN